MLQKCCYPEPEPIAGTGAGSKLDRLHNTALGVLPGSEGYSGHYQGKRGHLGNYQGKRGTLGITRVSLVTQGITIFSSGTC